MRINDANRTVEVAGEPGLIDYGRLALRGWWIVVLAVVTAMSLAAMASKSRPPVYEANATFLVIPSSSVIGSSNEAIISSINTLDRRTIVNTFAEIAASQSVASQAAARLTYTAEDLAQMKTRAVVLPETFAIEVFVEGPEPVRTAVLANAIRAETGALGSQAYPAYQIRPLDDASVPTAPIRPQPVRDVGLAGLGGLVLGVLAAATFEYLWLSSRWSTQASAPPPQMAPSPRSR